MTTQTWTNEAGTVRAKFRTSMTAADEFSRSFLTESVKDGRAGVQAESLARWCLERFVVEIEFKRGDAWTPAVPFSWSMFDAMAVEDVSDGWPQILAFEIFQATVKRSADNLDALKKTSVTPSVSSTSATPPRTGASSPT